MSDNAVVCKVFELDAVPGICIFSFNEFRGEVGATGEAS